MPTAPHRSVRTLGLWSATLCTVFSLAYVPAQLVEWVGLLGSSGGPHSRSTAAGLAVLLTPSLLLSVAFVALTVAVHHYARPSARVWTHLAVAFASMYATLVGMVYYVQLAFVMPRLSRGDTADIGLLIFEPFDSFLYAVDVFGYSLMSLPRCSPRLRSLARASSAGYAGAWLQTGVSCRSWHCRCTIRR
jgi:hypothetical protein